MRVIEIDGSDWFSVSDFYDTLLVALGAPRWHGRSIDALIDSMIYGDINEIDPPYTVRIIGANNLSPDIKKEIELVGQCLAMGRQDYYCLHGRDVEVRFELR